MTETPPAELERLAALLRTRNDIDAKIAALIGRPAERGHVGEYLAARLFDIRLADSATNAGLDGWFISGQLAGKSVDVKYYGAHEGLLDVGIRGIVDYYLVLTGPPRAAASSRGGVRPFAVDRVYLIDAVALHDGLAARGVKVGTATSVTREVWAAAMLYPENRCGLIDVTEGTRKTLELLATK